MQRPLADPCKQFLDMASNPISNLFLANQICEVPVHVQAAIVCSPIASAWHGTGELTALFSLSGLFHSVIVILL